jgi:predicted nucleic acid-binding protein
VAELLVDTDVLADHLRGARELQPGGDAISYSVITRAELFAGRGDEEAGVERLLAPLRELGVEREIAERAGRLRREHGIPLPDALIAATALVHRLTLTTRNTRHFGALPGLELRQPT